MWVGWGVLTVTFFGGGPRYTAPPTHIPTGPEGLGDDVGEEGPETAEVNSTLEAAGKSELARAAEALKSDPAFASRYDEVSLGVV